MDNANIIFILFVFLVGIIITLTQYQAKKEIVKRVIDRQDGKWVKISSILLSGDSGYSYHVKFIDRHNNEYSSRCRVSAWGEKVFWTRTPLELITAQQLYAHKYQNQPSAIAQPLEQSPSKPKTLSSKEQIIDDLQAEINWLRTELGQIRQQKEAS